MIRSRAEIDKFISLVRGRLSLYCFVPVSVLPFVVMFLIGVETTAKIPTLRYRMLNLQKNAKLNHKLPRWCFQKRAFLYALLYVPVQRIV